MTNTDNAESCQLAKKQHIKFFKRFLLLSPSRVASQECSRLTIAFFALSGLDVLNALDTLSPEYQSQIIEWIYSLQILPENINPSRCGFQGSNTHRIPGTVHGYETGHLAMTYTGLASLIILGDDLSRVNKDAVLAGVKALQQPNGSFCGTDGEESDMRFVYCAACICFILNDMSAIDRSQLAKFVASSISYDGGVAQGPHLESHGGSTFCGVAALHLCGLLDTTFNKTQLERLKRWCILRQDSGFHGRPNKETDTCYSFWVGGTLHILDAFDMVSTADNRKYIMSAQDNVTGGFSKWPDTVSDPLHTYLGLCGLSLMKEEGLLSVEASLNVTHRAHQFLMKLHRVWES